MKRAQGRNQSTLKSFGSSLNQEKGSSTLKSKLKKLEIDITAANELMGNDSMLLEDGNLR